MMNKRKLFNFLLALVIGLALISSGCRLAKEETKFDIGLEDVDEFRGLYITDSPLKFDNKESDASSNKIWGEIIESNSNKVQIKFPGSDGMNLFYALIGSESDNSLYRATFSDEKIFNGNFQFLGEEILIEGEIYFLASADKVFYINHVYQTIDGKIYAVSPEMGVKPSSFGNTKSYVEFSYSKSEEDSKSDSGAQETTLNVRADINIIPMDNVEKYVFLYMDTEDEVLDTMEVFENSQIENLTIDSDVEYIIVQTHHVDSSGEVYVSREILEKNQTGYTTKFFTEENLASSGLILLSWE